MSRIASVRRRALEASRRAVRTRGSLVLAATLVSTTLGGCRFSPYKFAGGGFPPNVRTVAVLPFDNETPVPELQREVFEAMRRAMTNRLNLRESAESKADAIVRGTIVKYEVDVPIAFSADPRQATTARRQLQIVVDVSITDQRDGKSLLDRKGLTAKGEYAERDEAGGRREAITRFINDIIEGAQSQW